MTKLFHYKNYFMFPFSCFRIMKVEFDKNVFEPLNYFHRVNNHRQNKSKKLKE